MYITINTKYLSTLYENGMKIGLKENLMMVSNIIKTENKSEYQKLFNSMKIRVSLIEEDGKVVYDSSEYKKEDKMDNHLERKEIKDIKTGFEAFDIRKSSTVKKVMAYYAEEMVIENGKHIIVRVSKEYESVQRTLKLIFCMKILFFCFLNMVIHYFYKNYLKRDMYRKIEKVEEYLKKDKVDLKLDLEEDEIVLNLWKIIEEWQGKNIKNIRNLNREKEILKQITNSIDTFIALFDEKMELIVKNRRLSYLYEEEKKDYKEMIKDIEIIEVLNQAKEIQEDQKKDVYISGLKRYFSIKVKVLKEYNRYLLSIKDITKERGLLEVQKTFISNISHELKTPLTNIKGYVIALDDAPEDLRKQFLKIIKSNVEKLENIVIDFLNITKIEKTNIVNIEKISFERLKSELEAILNSRIEENKVKIEYNLNLLNRENILEIDLDKVLTILKNLVENAIIYGNKNNPKVEISILESKSRYKIGVKDNGIGIAPDEIEKIFERFYRVDKARTSNKAGTGLGLAIVKDLVKICGGKIEVISKEGKGSIFIFTILK